MKTRHVEVVTLVITDMLLLSTRKPIIAFNCFVPEGSCLGCQDELAAEISRYVGGEIGGWQPRLEPESWDRFLSLLAGVKAIERHQAGAL